MLERFGNHKSDMVLYCAAIQSVTYPLIMHRVGVNSEREAVLLIDKNEFGRKAGDLEAIHRFKEQRIFSNVIDCDIFSVRKGAETNPKERYVEYFDQIFRQCGYPLERFSEIYVLNDSWDGDINLYFHFKNIEYTWIDVSKDYIPRPSTALKWYNELLRAYKALTPFARYAKPCILVGSGQTAMELEKEGKHYSTWDLDKIYHNLSTANVERICKCFRLDISPDSVESALIIKNSGWWYDDNAFKGWGGREDYIRLLSGSKPYFRDDFTPIFDKIALDFYATNTKKIFIKEHPSCPLNRIQEELYGEKVETFAKIPFEILAKYLKQQGIHFDTVIGYLSTSLSALNASLSNHRFALGKDFFRTCFFYSSLYAALLYAVHCKLKYIYCNTIIKSQLEFLMKTVDAHVELRTLDVYKAAGIKDSLIVLDYVLEGRGVQKEFLNRLQGSSAACFLNVELTEEFFDDSLMDNMAPIEIKKEKISEGFMNLQRDETLWIFSKNSGILKAARFFTMEKILPRCGLRVYVEESALAAGVEKFRELSDRRKARELTARVETLTKALLKIGNVELLTGMLQVETEVCRYIELLGRLKGSYLIILSVRDTPGDCLPEEAVRLVRELGFTKFTKELWRMYAGVSNRGEILCDAAGESREAPVSFQSRDGAALSVSSMAWRQGNKAEIAVNGTDYSVNLRGLNFVVYDLENQRLVDSAGFDCHTGQWRFQRRDH